MPDDALAWSAAWEDAAFSPDGFYRRTRTRAGDHFRTHVMDGDRVARRIMGIALPELFRLVDGSQRPSVTDAGAADGTLLRQLMSQCPADVRDRITWRGLDLAPRPPDLDPAVSWVQADVRTISEVLSPGPGILIAHELLDDLPCDVVEPDDDGRLRLVTVGGSGLQRLGPALDDLPACRALGVDARAAAAWVARWWDRREPACRIEVGCQRDDAWRSMTATVTDGLAIAIDYGHVLASRSAGAFDGGTLVGYRDGRITSPIPDGSCNLTAHVALDSCAAAVDARASRLWQPDGHDFWWLVQHLAR